MEYEQIKFIQNIEFIFILLLLMFNTQTITPITPWSIYDQNLKTYNKKTNPNSETANNLSKRQLYQKQSAIKMEFLASLHTNKQPSNKTMKNNSLQNLLDEQNNQNKKGETSNDDDSYQLLLNKLNKKPVTKKHKISSNKSQMVLKVAKFTQFEVSPQIQQEHNKVKQIMSQNLILKIIKKKLNEQINPLYDNVLNSQMALQKQFDTPNNKRSYSQRTNNKQKIFSINNQITHQNIQCQYQPLTIKKYHNISLQNNQISETKASRQKYKKRQLSNKLMFVQQIKKLEQLDAFLNSYKSSHKNQYQYKQKIYSRPSFKNNGILLQKYNSISTQNFNL